MAKLASLAVEPLPAVVEGLCRLGKNPPEKINLCPQCRENVEASIVLPIYMPVLSSNQQVIDNLMLLS